jgi:hypothetical protein
MGVWRGHAPRLAAIAGSEKRQLCKALPAGAGCVGHPPRLPVIRLLKKSPGQVAAETFA